MQFNSASWTKTLTTVSADAIVAPDGTLTADLIVEDTSVNSQHTVTGVGGVIGRTDTMAVFAHPKERSVLQVLGAGLSIQGEYPWFDLVGMTCGNPGPGVPLLSITDVGGGWARCSVTWTATTASGFQLCLTNVAAGPLPAAAVMYTGDGVSGAYLWGGMRNVGGLAPFVPT